MVGKYTPVTLFYRYVPTNGGSVSDRLRKLPRTRRLRQGRCTPTWRSIGRRSFKPNIRQSLVKDYNNHDSIASSEAPPTASPTHDLAKAEKASKNKEGSDIMKKVANIHLSLTDGNQPIKKLNIQ